jgi:hypothetical protein
MRMLPMSTTYMGLRQAGSLPAHGHSGAACSSHIQTDASTGMEFFSRDWKCLGSKGGLGTTISKVTGIPKEYLEGVDLAKASISMRMSWAANRQATRAEDVAYSLLGIFDVNMPLLYGEGKNKASR